jgi:hypothetical protein
MAMCRRFTFIMVGLRCAEFVVWHANCFLVYYHAVLLTFRPFLVAMASTHQKPGLMWLRAACRKATDAAQDSLVFISNQQNASTACRVRSPWSCPNDTMKLMGLIHSQESRYTAFFIESNCAVLLYDSLWHPTKLAYNLEFIHMGLNCLNQMADAQPVLNARTSISRMVGAVEQAVSRRSGNASGRFDHPTSVRSSTTQNGPDSRSSAPLPSSHETTFTSLANDFIYLSDRQNQAPAAYQSQQQVVPPSDQAASLEAGSTMADPMSLLDFDVLTTDLYNFFPIQTPMANTDFGHTDQV